MNKVEIKYLDKIKSPRDLDDLNDEQLKELATELRYDVIETVSKTGGHLGASLGVIELTVALHKIFDSPKDKIIWDVGHQSYPHKILTGRRDQMSTLRKKDGLSGFTKRDESKYDHFGAQRSIFGMIWPQYVQEWFRSLERMGHNVRVIPRGVPVKLH